MFCYTNLRVPLRLRDLHTAPVGTSCLSELKATSSHSTQGPSEDGSEASTHHEVGISPPTTTLNLYGSDEKFGRSNYDFIAPAVLTINSECRWKMHPLIC